MVGFPITAKLTSSDPGGDDGDIIQNIILLVAGWGVEWIRITISTGEMFSCPVYGWLDNDDPKEPSSRTVSCVSLGNIVTVRGAW